MELKPRTAEETSAWNEGFNFAVKLIVRRLETANDETDRLCLIEAIKRMSLVSEPPKA